MRKVGRVARIGAIKPLDLRRPEAADWAPAERETGLPTRLQAGGGVRKVELDPPELTLAAEAIGRERAQRVWRLREKGAVGTLPELCTMEWLERKRTPYEFQSAQMGGRRIAGGAVIDFLVDISAAGWYVWRVQGEYWHSGMETEARDEAQAERLMRLRIGGRPVAAVVDLWELDIYDRYPTVFELAEAGVGMRR